MNKPQRYVSVQQLYKSQQRVQLVCEFYGPTHPKCKRAVAHDTALYMRFLKQFQIRDDDDDDESYVMDQKPNKRIETLDESGIKNK